MRNKGAFITRFGLSCFGHSRRKDGPDCPPNVDLFLSTGLFFWGGGLKLNRQFRGVGVLEFRLSFGVGVIKSLSIFYATHELYFQRHLSSLHSSPKETQLF